MENQTPMDSSLNVSDLSEKEWLQKYHIGKYQFKEEHITRFPENVQHFIRSWPKIEDTYSFFVSPLQIL